MNVNKVELNAELGLKQETGLKCMEFATQYMLKKAQYRLLNPLHTKECSLIQLNQQSQLMAELNAQCARNPVMLSKSLESNILSLIQQQLSISRSRKYQPSQKYTKQQQLSQQYQPKVSQSSVSEYTHPIIQRTSSETISNNSSQSSLSSKKSKNKFQQVIRKPSLKHQQAQKAPKIDMFDFKKKKLPQLRKQQQITSKQQQDNQQKSFKKEFTDSDDDDSFDNLPLPSAQKQQDHLNNSKQDYNNNRQSIKSQDLNSYHSSIIMSQKKIAIDIVSEHLSQNQISVVTESQILSKEIKQSGCNIELKQQKKQSSLKIQQQEENNEKEQHHQQQQRRQQQQDYMKQKQQLLKQIRKDLIKLESFDVQQEILIKRLHKIWTAESQTIKQVKNITWDQLNLLKSTFRSNLHLYAQVIE